MRKKGTALLLAVMLVCGTILGACGGKSSEGSGSSAKTEDGKTTVRFMVGGSAAELESYKVAVDAFNEQSDETFVEMISVPGDNYSEKVMTQLKSKSAPDCFYSEEEDYGELNKSGILLGLDDYLDHADSTLNREDVPENILATYSYNGEVTGVPVDCNPMVIYYNATLFEETGIKSPQEYFDEGAWDFNALQEVSEQLRDKEKIGFIVERWWGPFLSFTTSRGQGIYAEDGSTADFNTDRAKDGMTYVQGNIESGAFTYAGKVESGESPDTLFMSGDAGLLYAGRWFVADFVGLPFTYDVVPFPYYEEPGDAISAMPATPLVINKDTKNADNVWEFISYYCGETGQRLRMEGEGNAVPTIDGLEEIVLTGAPEHAQYFLDAVDISFLFPAALALNPGLSMDIDNEFEKLLIGESTVDEAVKGLTAVVNDKMADN